MKKFIFFYWDNCPSCDLEKPRVEDFIEQTWYEITKVHESDMEAFMYYRVRGKPVFMEVDEHDQEIGRQVSPFDFSKYK